MTSLETAVLGLHIGAGVFALLAGFGAMVAEKGGRRHVLSGRVFAVTLAVVLLTVPVLAALDPTTFRLLLTLVAVFTGYFLFAGYRLATRKREANDATAVDWAALAALGLACAGLIGGGGWLANNGDQFGLVLVVFGLIALSSVSGEWRRFRGSDDADTWMTDHLSYMVAANIATVTAVSAINLPVLPVAVRWLWPTVAGTALIVYWQQSYGTD